MKNTFAIIGCALLVTACSNVVTYKDHSKDVTEEKTDLEKSREFIQQAAAMQYIDYADVIADTAYIGVPSRRGAAHSQDNIARIFLSDMRKHGHFDNIYCCKVINISKESDFVWKEDTISGPVIGYASIDDK